MLNTEDLPDSLLFVGGGPVGCGTGLLRPPVRLRRLHRGAGQTSAVHHAPAGAGRQLPGAQVQAPRHRDEEWAPRSRAAPPMPTASKLNSPTATKRVFDGVLVGTGRRPVTGDLGLEQAGIAVSRTVSSTPRNTSNRARPASTPWATSSAAP
ncbi:MAG: hypothetical protein MZW92_79010 [Comamonadaceae bacterium]|nr:hypothetical protein [Comamonadaceae bacterium]